MESSDIDLHTLPPPAHPLDDLYPFALYMHHPPGALIMLRLIAYDISDPKRWRHVSNLCEDYGLRVQYSLFECWLEDDVFADLWRNLQELIDPKEDRLVSYTLDSAAVRKRQTAGDSMHCTEKTTWYVV
jgi:CRISPR-associated protein Cas2